LAAVVLVLSMIIAVFLARGLLRAPKNADSPSVAQIPASPQPPVRPENISPADSLPALSEPAYFYMSACDVKTISSFLSWLSESASKTDPARAHWARPASGDLGEAAGLFSFLADAADSSEGMAACVTSGDGTGAYASFVMRGEKFDIFMAGINEPQGYRLDELTGGTHDGPDVWKLRIVSGDISSDLCYVARRRIAEQDVLMVASNEGSIEAMNDALEDPSKRMVPALYTEGENCVQLKFAAPASVASEPFPVVLEASWVRDEHGIGVKTYSNIYSRAAFALAGRNIAEETSPIPGKGEVVMYTSLDPAFLLYAAFPRESDPIKFALERSPSPLPAQISAALEKVLGNCRISAAIVREETTPSAAYVILQTVEDEALQKLITFAAMFLRPEAGAEGWDEAYTVPVGQRGASASLAAKKGMALLGVGDLRLHGRKNEFPGRDASLASSSGVLRFFLSSGLFSMKSSEGGQTISEMLAAYASAREIPAFLLSALKNMERVSLSLELNGWGNLDIVMEKPMGK
jgi:hypothetical protein